MIIGATDRPRWRGLGDTQSTPVALYRGDPPNNPWSYMNDTTGGGEFTLRAGSDKKYIDELKDLHMTLYDLGSSDRSCT